MRLRLALLVALIASPALAQAPFVRRASVGSLPACVTIVKSQSRAVWVTDGQSEADCSTGGGAGNARKMSHCVCVWTAGTSAYEWQAFARGAAGATSPAIDVNGVQVYPAP